MQYRPEIDGLRAIAVIPVILFHAGFETFSGGFVGVDVFFVISGYLITSIIVSELDAGTFTLRSFYERRARRILPALFFVIACCIPVAWFTLTPNDMKDFAQSVFAAATFSSNILFWRESGYFATAAELKPLLHTWSLAVEEQYYILFPLFMIVAWRYFRALVPTFLALVFLLSFALSQYAAYNHPAANFYLLPTRGWELLIGVFIALYIDRIRLSRRTSSAISALGLALILISVLTFNEAIPFPSVYALVPTLGTACVIIGSRTEHAVRKALAQKWMVTLGILSYSLYLWHQPIFSFLRHVTIGNMSATSILLALVITTFLSWATHALVEKPLRRRAVSWKFLAKTLGVGILLCTIGLGGHFTYGFMYYRSNLPYVSPEINVSKEEDKRQAAIRAGICHFNRRGSHQDISTFLDEWGCTDKDEELKSTGILITGDSHSADKAVALRVNGYDAFQIGGAGCPLSQAYVTGAEKYCGEILEKARQVASDEEVTSIFLSSRFRLNQLSSEYLQSVVNYWKDVEKPVFLWSPMPNFQTQLQSYVRRGDSSPQPIYQREDKFYGLLDDVEMPEQFYIIKTSDMYCSDTTNDGCVSFSDKRILMTDGDHLGVEGAKIFGQNFVKTDVFQQAKAR